MKSLLSRFDIWVQSGPFNPRDLARYRVAYGLLMLVSLPRYSWVSSLTPEYFNPPPGPLMLFPGFAPFWFLTGVEMLLALCFACIVFGVYVRASSIAATALMLIGYGSVYSTGKVSHSILFVILPLVMSFVPWGARGGFDQPRRRAPLTISQSPMRYMALLIGLAYLTAGAQKLLSGWLDPTSQATQGHFFRSIIANGRDQWLAQFFSTFDVPIFWEFMDFSTIVLEVGIIFAVITWKSFRIFLAIAAIFHLGVLLMLNIGFNGNLAVYAAFIPWSRIPLPGWTARLHLGRSAPIVAVVVAAASWAGSKLYNAADHIDQVILFIGGGVGVAYLIVQALQLLKWLISRRTAGPRAPVPAEDTRIKEPQR